MQLTYPQPLSTAWKGAYFYQGVGLKIILIFNPTPYNPRF